jgi:hypothetical protein
MNDVPALDPAFFEWVLNRVHAIVNGEASIDPRMMASARDHVAGMVGDQATEAHVALVAVAFERSSTRREFRALIARFEAFMDLLADAETMVLWATRGRVQMSGREIGRLAPARMLNVIAATCPLSEDEFGFDMVVFERLAERAIYGPR